MRGCRPEITPNDAKVFPGNGPTTITMNTENPVATTVFPWLRENLGDRSLSVLVGNDYRAISAAVQIIELYSYDGHPSLVAAYGAVVRRMSPPGQEFAYHAIAHVMDWPDRSRIWVEAGLPEFAPQLCVNEPH